MPKMLQFFVIGYEDPQLKLAIELSLQHSQPSVCSACITALNSTPLTSIASAHTFLSPTSTQPFNTVDITVDYFLKSLACCDLQSFESSIDQDWESNKLSQDFQSHTTNEMEDGRFQIGDLHENGGRFPGEDDDHEASKMMRRSHSTGDLCTRPTVVPVCSYFDSDHSHHEDKPEELARRNLRQAASAEEDSHGLDCTTSCELAYGGQSSIDDTSDSLNADLEVCEILGTTDDETSSEHKEEITLPPKLKPKLESTKKNISTTINTINTHSNNMLSSGPSSINNNINTNNSSLRIRICKSPKLDTDSSNEYESETGIPKSPTLFISGVSISRTPEPRSPAIIALSGRQSRSSSLTVPVPPSSSSQSPEPLHSPKSPLLEPGGSPRNSRSSSLAVPVHTGSGTLPPTPTLTTSSPTPTSPTSPASPNLIPSPSDASSGNLLLSPGISKSASEPEREKEMFRFPKSSTDGALSSVLLVQESNLSSDDFHEALFLEKSPKSSKRRKRSKKDRNKENGVESTSKPTSNSLSTPVAERRASKEASSVL
jgi:ankyrin repeat/IBR domain-containing protein 1